MTDDLRELVEEWREFAEGMDATDRVAGYAQGFADAADELEEALDENEERRPNARVMDQPWGCPDDD